MVRLTLHVKSEIDTRCGGALDERSEIGDTGLGRKLPLGGVTAHDPEQAACLCECFASRFLDSEDCLARTLAIRAQQHARAARLHGHHAHTLRDHVVQLVRDPGPLVGDRGLGLFGL
jgi:hypothetical protein